MTVGIINRMLLVGAAVLALGAGSVVAGQNRAAPPPVRSAKEAAPADLTGYWVSVVNKDWRFRMVIPAKGDFFGVIGGIPINAEARRVAEAWDPAKDEASGEACRAFGAAHLMQIPGRLHITWQNDTTLRVETDAGMQTRLFHFNAAAPPRGGPSWQGYSAAKWVNDSLEVVTRNLRPGYLRRNGLPYSAATSMTEYWDLLNEPDGSDWLVISTTIVDPTYLRMPYEMSPVFKRERDGSKWDPSQCSARW
ncbi:MAG TPA: hypothetical protein VH702_11410 [Vicinamibacterales bacterium]|jgi:hypothetical protein